jgi:phosphotransacetylase
MKSLLKEIESKFKDLEEQDQDRDGDKDFADVMIARMMKSGMSREDAIKKVRDKQYNEATIVAKDTKQAGLWLRILTLKTSILK